MLNSLCGVVFFSVDSMFCNGVSIDAVVVIGSLLPIQWLCMQVMCAGSFAYQAYQKYEKNCFLLSLAAGILCGALIAIFSGPISHIFALTDTQHKMLQEALILYGCGMPIEAISRFLRTYITYKRMNRLIIISNFISYALLIGTDWLAVSMGWGVFGLVAFTELSWLAYFIIVLAFSGFNTTKDKISPGIIIKCAGHAKDLMIARGMGRFANIIFGHYLSLMGEADYAIFSVCVNATSISDEFRDATVDFSIVRLKGQDDKKQAHKRVLRQCFIPSMLIPITASYLCLMLLHGKVELSSAIGYMAFFNLPSIIYPFYDTLFAYFMSRRNTKVTLLRGVCNCIWRIPAAALVSLLGGGIIAFAMLYTCDYLTAALIYFWIYKRDRKEAFADG